MYGIYGYGLSEPRSVYRHYIFHPKTIFWRSAQKFIRFC